MLSLKNKDYPFFDIENKYGPSLLSKLPFFNGKSNGVISKKEIKFNSFINRAKNRHGDLYIYDIDDYINMGSKMRIWCIKCQKFFIQSPASHVNNNGCICTRSRKTVRHLNQESFIQLAKECHGDKYNYDKVVFVNMNTKILIYCNTCLEYFSQSPSGHVDKVRPH